MTTPIFYTINEERARQARQMWSFTDYEMGSNTEHYQKRVTEVYRVGDIAKTRTKEDRHAYIDVLCERFSRKYAEWINRGVDIEMYCPSVMITGPSNFPVRKKEQQNRMSEKHYTEDKKAFDYIEDKLANMGTSAEPIKSNDVDAIETLKYKVNQLKEKQSEMKALNAHYRKHKTMQNFELFTDEQAEKIDKAILETWYKTPYAPFDLTSINNKIKSAQARIDSITKAKEKGTSEIETDICKVIENVETMRIQLIFDGKPSEAIRTILKANAFKYAPSSGAWQRQLTANGKYATTQVLKQIAELEERKEYNNND